MKASGMYRNKGKLVKVNNKRVGFARGSKKANAELSSDFINKGSRKYMKDLGFAWSEVADNVVGASNQAIRNGLLDAQYELLERVYDYHKWKNATGNAITSFLSGVYDWTGNVYIRNLGEFGNFGNNEAPRFKLAPGVFHGPGMKDRGVHWGNRFKQKGTYFISDRNLIGDGDDTPDYYEAKRLIDDAANLIPNIRKGIGKHQQSQALRFEHPIEYEPETEGSLTLLEFANRNAKSTVKKYIVAEMNRIQDEINKGGSTSELRDRLGRFVKGTGVSSNVGRGSGGKFTSLK